MNVHHLINTLSAGASFTLQSLTSLLETPTRQLKRVAGDRTLSPLEVAPLFSRAAKVDTTLAFHAETLHQYPVWQRVQEVARWMAEHGIRVTFFVYPFPAAVYGVSIHERVRPLAALGHEIAQHTHFYAGRNIDKHNKVDDLSKGNIFHYVRRDFEALAAIDHRPRGFAAGSWFVNDTVLDALVDLGFVYDCSAQFPKPKPLTQDPRSQWLRSPQTYRNNRGQLVCLPTTCSLGEWFKWGRKAATENSHFHQIVYLHDYDLLTSRGYLMLFCFLRMIRGESLEPTASAAEHYLPYGEPSSCP
jgi:hypothetical protein